MWPGAIGCASTTSTEGLKPGSQKTSVAGRATPVVKEDAPAFERPRILDTEDSGLSGLEPALGGGRRKWRRHLWQPTGSRGEVGIALEPLPGPAGPVQIDEGLVAFGIAPVGARTYAGDGLLLGHGACLLPCGHPAMTGAARPFDDPSRDARDKPPRARSISLAGGRRRHRLLSIVEARVGFRVFAASFRKSLQYSQRQTCKLQNLIKVQMNSGRENETRDCHSCTALITKLSQDHRF